MYACGSADRHDQAHLLSHHAQMPLPALAAVLSNVSLCSSTFSLLPMVMQAAAPVLPCRQKVCL